MRVTVEVEKTVEIEAMCTVERSGDGWNEPKTCEVDSAIDAVNIGGNCIYAPEWSDGQIAAAVRSWARGLAASEDDVLSEAALEAEDDGPDPDEQREAQRED